MEEKNLKQSLDVLQTLAKERTVKTQNIEYDLETLVRKINKGIIKLNPDYQRKHRWNNKISSRLIESLILNIPIPTIYLSQDIDVDDEVGDDVARYSVIDGQQRLTAIYNFMMNNYAIEGLDVLGLLDGSLYRDLPPFLIRRLEERTIKCLRIDSTVDSQVKFDIFERLNSGAVQLESQELRNAIYRGSFNNMIKKVSKDHIFMEMLNIDISDFENDTKVKKMLDVEYVLRFFAFYNGEGTKMKKSFKQFLSEQMNKYNSYGTEKIEQMSAHFQKVIKLIYDEIGKDAFAKFKVENNELVLQSHFNAAVYDAVAIAVSNRVSQNQAFEITDEMRTHIRKLFHDAEFITLINGSTNDKSKILQRISKVEEVLS